MPRSLTVFVHSSNEMFGADRMLVHVVRSLVDHGSFTAEVWIPDDVSSADTALADALEQLGARVRILPLPILRRKYLTARNLPSLLARSASLWARLVVARPAVVYCATSAALLAAPAARLAGSRSVVLHAQEIWGGREARVLGLLGAFCTSAVAISDSVRASIVGPLRARAVTVTNAMPDATVPLVDIDHREPLRLLVASRWNSWKGHATLIRAWGDARPDAVLTIAGSPPEQGMAVDVKSLVAALPDPSSVRIVGQVDDVTALVDASDFMIVPSDDPEPFGLVAIEAFRRGRAVIASAEGGLGQIVTDGVDGLVFPNRSADGLRRILERLTKRDAAELGAAARRTFLARYSISRFDEEFAAIWTVLAARVGVGPRRRTVRTRAAEGDVQTRRARLYRTLRSAHLERARELPPATILYESRRYDYDESAAHGLHLVQAGPWRAARLISSSSIDSLEINEPLMVPSLPRTAAVLLALRLRRTLSGRPMPSVGCYAIENRDPFSARAGDVRARVAAARDRALARFVASQVDRVVFGTSMSRDLYAARTPRSRAASTLIPALPAPLTEPARASDPGRGDVLFLGALSERKGFPLLTRAWAGVRGRRPGSRLTIVGAGALEQVATDLAREDPTVALLVDPGREEVRRQLARARILVLPSQPTDTWREQVGLPIVEGLAYGCLVVTTDQTGLAEWLIDHGHFVIPAGDDPDVLVDAVVAAIDSDRDVAGVLADLPQVDGRLAADRWLSDGG